MTGAYSISHGMGPTQVYDHAEDATTYARLGLLAQKAEADFWLNVYAHPYLRDAPPIVSPVRYLSRKSAHLAAKQKERCGYSPIYRIRVRPKEQK